MLQKRWDHACFVDEETSAIHLVVGKNVDGLRLTRTDSWVFKTESWQDSLADNLPERIDESSAVSSNSKEYVGYVAGGEKRNRKATRKIWGLRRKDKIWVELIQQLKTGRESHSLVNIPSEKVLGC